MKHEYEDMELDVVYLKRPCHVYPMRPPCTSGTVLITSLLFSYDGGKRSRKFLHNLFRPHSFGSFLNIVDEEDFMRWWVVAGPAVQHFSVQAAGAKAILVEKTDMLLEQACRRHYAQ